MMKKCILSLLKAAVYTGVFLGIQMCVTIVLTVGATLIGELRWMITGIAYNDRDLMGDLVSSVTVVSCIIALLFFVILFALRGKSFSAEVRWQKMPYGAQAMLGPLSCGFGLALLASFALALIPFPENWYAAYDESMEIMLSGDPLYLAIATVFAAPIVEEVVFRGLVYTRLCRGMKRWIAAFLSAVIFGLVHGTLLHLLYTVPMGLLLCLFYEKYRSLWAPIILHMSFNLAGTVIGYYSIDSYVTIVLMIAAGLYLTLIGLLSMRWYRRDCTPQSIPTTPASDNAALTNYVDH